MHDGITEALTRGIGGKKFAFTHHVKNRSPYFFLATDSAVYCRNPDGIWDNISTGLPGLVFGSDLKVLRKNTRPATTRLFLSTYGWGLFATDLTSSPVFAEP
jgi:hypothetical protein